jgi:hypothetical protein
MAMAMMAPATRIGSAKRPFGLSQPFLHLEHHLKKLRIFESRPLHFPSLNQSTLK